MAEEARLPQPVVDIIAEHHGTSLVAYFYRKATAGDIEVDEAPFRYEGRPPESKEAALVMIADVADAAGRALVDCGPVQIEDAVRKVVAAKVADGQLAASGLTRGGGRERSCASTLRCWRGCGTGAWSTRSEPSEE